MIRLSSRIHLSLKNLLTQRLHFSLGFNLHRLLQSPPGGAAAARDLPRVSVADTGVRSQSLAPIAGAPGVPTRVRGELSSDPIELDDGSDDDGKEEDVNARPRTQEAVQDLGAVALQALMDLNMTASEWLRMTDRERPWKTARNHHEAVNIVRIFDQIGLRSNNFIRSLMLKRIIALQHFDQTGNVNVLDVVQGSPVELLPQKMINAIYTQLQRRTQSQADNDEFQFSSAYSEP